jgi:hypothetical protein
MSRVHIPVVRLWRRPVFYFVTFTSSGVQTLEVNFKRNANENSDAEVAQPLREQ